MNTDTAIQQARAIIRQIRQNHRQYATAILLRALSTVLPGIVVLLALAFVSNYVIGTIDANFANRLYTSLASGITLVIAVLTTRAAWLWANRRFKGWTLIRTVGQVNGDIRQLERAIHAGEVADPDRIMAAAQAAWETHVAAMQAAGFEV